VTVRESVRENADVTVFNDNNRSCVYSCRKQGSAQDRIQSTSLVYTSH